MRRILTVVMLAAALVVPAAAPAQSPTCWISGRPPIVAGFETLTISNAVKKFDPVLAAGALMAEVGKLETDQVRYRTDGAPTSAVGHLVDVGDKLYVCGPSLGRIGFIRVTTDASAPVTYYK